MSASIQHKVVGKSVVDQHAAQVSGNVANAQALAEAVVRYAQGEDKGTLKGFLAKIAGLSKEGRTAFRATLDVTLKAIAENVKAMGNDSTAKRAANSARVRISECRKFSQSCDAGFNLESVEKGNGYAAIISMARAFKESTATAGPSVKRGRKPLTWNEKLAKYCSDTLKLDHDQMEQAAVMLRKLAKSVA